MSKQTDLAYLAGLVDGEGCIRVKKCKPQKSNGAKNPCYQAMIQVRMVDEQALEFLATVLGGWYYKEKPHSCEGKPLYCFQASCRAAEHILNQLLPYLRVKRACAQNVLALRTLQKESRKHRTKIVGKRAFPNQYGTVRFVANKRLSDEYLAMCESLYQRSKELNS